MIFMTYSLNGHGCRGAHDCRGAHSEMISCPESYKNDYMTKATDDEQELLEKQSHLESHKAILDSNILNLQNHVKTVTFFSLKGLHHKIVSL